MLADGYRVERATDLWSFALLGGLGASAVLILLLLASWRFIHYRDSWFSWLLGVRNFGVADSAKLRG